MGKTESAVRASWFSAAVALVFALLANILIPAIHLQGSIVVDTTWFIAMLFIGILAGLAFFILAMFALDNCPKDEGKTRIKILMIIGIALVIVTEIFYVMYTFLGITLDVVYAMVQVAVGILVALMALGLAMTVKSACAIRKKN